MMKETVLSRSIRLVFSGGVAIGLGMLAQPALAQEAGQSVQRVEITGSSIKRVEAETALPVTVIKREDIEKSGVTSVTDLIQNLPAMQGFLTGSQSVNGGGGGNTNASLHSIGSKYTLVLLNGRRMAPYNSGTTVNLESIPLSAVERVEVLTDGASALYGADAVAGVVNFILKKDYMGGDVTATVNLPDHKHGESGQFSITKGFGDIEKDRFNVLLSLAGEKQTRVRAQDREVSRQGGVGPNFWYNGKLVGAYNTSSNSIPGVVFLDDGNAAVFSPSLFETGACNSLFTVKRGNVCRFNFAGTVDAIPEQQRTSFFASGRFKLAENHQLFTELVYSDYSTKAAYAPPAQPGLFLTQALYDKHVKPFLGQLGLTEADFPPVGTDPNVGIAPYMNLRLYDAGPRQDDYRTKTFHWVGGAEGSIGDLDYTVSYTHSENKATDTLLSGYTSKNKFYDLVNSGAFDPLAANTDSSVAILAPAVFKGYLFDSSKSTLELFNAHGSMPLMKLAGGTMAAGFGIDLSKQTYKDDPSPLSMGANALQPNFTDTSIGGSSGALPFDSSRKSKGAYAEIAAPVVKGFELSGALRYDSFDAVTNDRNFDAAGNPIGAATQGKSASSSTYKVSARWQPTNSILIRGSYGTGFRAPSLADITNPVQAFGNTGFHGCPPGLPASLAAACKSQSYEYNLRTGGNPNSDDTGLRPEKSTQYTLGFRVEPTAAISFGVDYWHVEIKDRISTVPEDVSFADGATYAKSFSVLPDPITGVPTLTLTQQPLNLGKAKYSGLDFDITSRLKLDIGKLSTRAAMTYMLKSDYEIPDASQASGYRTETSLGKLGQDTQVTFRWILNVSTSLESGKWTNTLNATVKPGYWDDVAAADGSSATLVRAYNPTTNTYGALQDVRRKVASYAVFDWQGKYQWSKELALTVGVKNIFDRDPPLSIVAVDGTGNMRGFDARYYDPLGRQFYLTASYKF